MPKSLQVLTLGCSKNTVDTEHLLFQAGDAFDVVPAEARPDFVDYLLVNTCGFIGDAKEESIQAILEAGQRKERGEVGKLIVFGCLSQRYPTELPGLIPEVDEWYGARDLVPVLKAIGAAPSPERRCGRVRTEGRPGTAFLKISEGCDRSCAYCAIPGIRGAHRSVPMEDLVAEARFLSSKGVRELVIIAQDTTYYGLDLYRRRALAELLQRLSEVEGIEWLRIHYSYPSGFPRDVLEQMASNPKVCPYLDIPLQHISDRVLSLMQRHCTGAETRALVRDLREKVPGVVLRTTMIVGHPGEGEREFGELLDFVREARFERLGAFKYSEEEGTYGAEHYADDVPEEVKEARLAELMETQREISLAFNQSRVGTVERVLVDAFDGDTLVCRSRYESPDVDGEILVRYEAGAFGLRIPAEVCGTFIDVRIIGADEYDLIAEIVKN
ncbi:MAG: 30S ribosomal protein S12 methylthiotransferase RimO [Bacteroidales bacterium]|nr:30S ribosomal protein S12 methylthiotransferase RimO [Bacteroidales bacterium]